MMQMSFEKLDCVEDEVKEKLKEGNICRAIEIVHESIKQKQFGPEKLADIICPSLREGEVTFKQLEFLAMNAMSEPATSEPKKNPLLAMNAMSEPAMSEPKKEPLLTFKQVLKILVKLGPDTDVKQCNILDGDHIQQILVHLKNEIVKSGFLANFREDDDV